MGERRFKSLLPGQRIVNVGVMVQPTSPRIAVFIGLADTQLLGCCSNGARVALKQAMGKRRCKTGTSTATDRVDATYRETQ